MQILAAFHIVIALSFHNTKMTLKVPVIVFLIYIFLLNQLETLSILCIINNISENVMFP